MNGGHDQEDPQHEAKEPDYKPNYLSVMNYRYQLGGIPIASAVGSSTRMACLADSDCGGDGGMCVGGVCARLDFSRQTLPAAGNTPGALDELDLSEPAGLGSTTADLFTFHNGICDVCDHTAATTGPVDWSGTGSQFVSFCNYIDVGVFSNEHAQADVNGEGFSCDPADVLHGARPTGPISRGGHSTTDSPARPWPTRPEGAGERWPGGGHRAW